MTESPVKPLTRLERCKLEQAIETIQTHRIALEETVTALIEIRDGQLYRETHKTFSEFCFETFGFKERWAQNLIRGEEAVTELTDTHHGAPVITPENMGVLKRSSAKAKLEIAKIPQGKRAEAALKALAESNGEPPTAKGIKEAGAEVQHRAKPKPSPTGEKAEHQPGRAATHPVLAAMDDWYQHAERVSAYSAPLNPRKVYEGLRKAAEGALAFS